MPVALARADFDASTATMSLDAPAVKALAMMPSLPPCPPRPKWQEQLARNPKIVPQSAHRARSELGLASKGGGPLRGAWAPRHPVPEAADRKCSLVAMAGKPRPNQVTSLFPVSGCRAAQLEAINLKRGYRSH